MFRRVEEDRGGHAGQRFLPRPDEVRGSTSESVVVRLVWHGKVVHLVVQNNPGRFGNQLEFCQKSVSIVWSNSLGIWEMQYVPLRG